LTTLRSQMLTYSGETSTTHSAPKKPTTTETAQSDHRERVQESTARALGGPGGPQEEVMVSLSVAVTDPELANGLVLVKLPGGVSVAVFDRVPGEAFTVATTV
jgi:hypothetical protein